MASLAALPDDIVAAAPAHPPAAPHDLRIDQETQLIRATLRGDWSLDHADDYLQELVDLLDESRRRFGRVRMLVDRRGWSIQTPRVVDRLVTVGATMLNEGDRLAVIVDTSLTKGRIRSMFRHDGSQAFLSDTAAELWLSAWP